MPAGRCTPTGGASCRDEASAAALGVPADITPLWVRSGAVSEGADGSPAHPFGSLASALRDAPADAWIALRNGDYEETVAVARSAHVVGACPSRVTLSAPASAPAVISLGENARLDLRGVTVRGGVAGVIVDDGAALDATGVVFDATASYGVRVASRTASVTLRDCAFTAVATGAAPRPTDAAAVLLAGGGALIERCHFEGLGAAALRAGGATSSASVTDSLVDGAADTAVILDTGAGATLTRTSLARAPYAALSLDNAHATVTDLAIRDVTLLAPGYGRGIVVGGGATLQATRLSVVGPVMTGLWVDGEGSFVRLAGAVLAGGTMARCRNAGAGPAECTARFDAWPTDAVSDFNGQTVRVTGGASLSARNLSIVEGEGIALLVQGGRADVDGLRVAHYRGQREGYPGYHPGGAVSVFTGTPSHGSALTLRDGVIEGNGIYGLSVVGAGASVTATRLIVRDNHTPAWAGAEPTGFGVVVDSGATLAASGARLERNEGCALCALTRGYATLEGSLVAGTVLAPGIGNGSGVIAQEGSDVVVRGSVVATNMRAGVTTTLGGHVTLDRSVVRDTLPHPPEALATLPPGNRALVGPGLYVETSGRIDATLTNVSGNRGIAVAANGAAASLRLDHCIIADTLAAQGLSGRGVESHDGARVDVTASLLLNNQQISANVNGAGSYLSLSDVAIRATQADANNAAGFGVQVVLGGRASLDRVWIDDSARIGVAVTNPGSRALLRDVLVTNVHSSMIGDLPSQGFGVYVAGGGSLVGERLAVASVGGAGVASVFNGSPAQVDLRDVYVDGVRDAQIRSEQPLGRPVAYGLHVSGAAAMTARRAVVIDAGYGFARIGGTLDLAELALVRPRSEAGSSTGSGPGQGLWMREACVRDSTHTAVAADQDLPPALVDTRTHGCAFPPCHEEDSP